MSTLLSDEDLVHSLGVTVIAHRLVWAFLSFFHNLANRGLSIDVRHGAGAVASLLAPHLDALVESASAPNDLSVVLRIISLFAQHASKASLVDHVSHREVSVASFPHNTGCSGQGLSMEICEAVWSHHSDHGFMGSCVALLNLSL